MASSNITAGLRSSGLPNHLTADDIVPIRRGDLYALYGTLFHTTFQYKDETEDEADERLDRTGRIIYGDALAPAPPVVLTPGEMESLANALFIATQPDDGRQWTYLDNLSPDDPRRSLHLYQVEHFVEGLAELGIGLTREARP